jgi:hypothetical protein
VIGVNNSVAGGKWFDECRLLKRKGEEGIAPPADVQANLSRTYHEYKNDFEIWHPRLAHINPRMALIAKPDLKDWPRKAQCDDCTIGKFHRHPHSGKRPLAALQGNT